MKVDIFIRTYSGDLEWLKYCLRSINKFATGFNEVIICIPQNHKHLIDSWNLTKERIITCKDYGAKDYLGQQISKLFAWKESDADAILFMDSDCIFIKSVTPESYFKDGKPIIYKTDYSKVGDAICWKKVTEKFACFPLQFEYMRQMPLVYWRETLYNVCGWQGQWHPILAEQGQFEQRILKQPGNQFSEFNLIGAYAERYESQRYIFIETDLGTAKRFENNPLIQYWSWGGIESKREEIENYLR